jgi:choline transporter-like protein 2/4/5
MCVYNTTVVGNRLCFPGAEVFSMVKGLTDAVSKSVNMDMITSAMNDVDKGMDIIYASFGIIFLLGIVYMIFVRLFSGVIVWICIILFFILLAILGIWVHEKSKAIDQAIKDNDGIETEGNTKDTRDTYLYVSYGILAIWCICIIGLLCMWNNIRLAIAIIKTATIFTI